MLRIRAPSMLGLGCLALFFLCVSCTAMRDGGSRVKLIPRVDRGDPRGYVTVIEVPEPPCDGRFLHMAYLTPYPPGGSPEPLTVSEGEAFRGRPRPDRFLAVAPGEHEWTYCHPGEVVLPEIGEVEPGEFAMLIDQGRIIRLVSDVPEHEPLSVRVEEGMVTTIRLVYSGCEYHDSPNIRYYKGRIDLGQSIGPVEDYPGLVKKLGK